MYQVHRAVCCVLLLDATAGSLPDRVPTRFQRHVLVFTDFFSYWPFDEIFCRPLTHEGNILTHCSAAHMQMLLERTSNRTNCRKSREHRRHFSTIRSARSTANYEVVLVELIRVQLPRPIQQYNNNTYIHHVQEEKMHVDTGTAVPTAPPTQSIKSKLEQLFSIRGAILTCVSGC